MTCRLFSLRNYVLIACQLIYRVQLKLGTLIIFNTSCSVIFPHTPPRLPFKEKKVSLSTSLSNSLQLINDEENTTETFLKIIISFVVSSRARTTTQYEKKKKIHSKRTWRAGRIWEFKDARKDEKPVAVYVRGYVYCTNRFWTFGLFAIRRKKHHDSPHQVVYYVYGTIEKNGNIHVHLRTVSKTLKLQVKNLNFLSMIFLNTTWTT